MDANQIEKLAEVIWNSSIDKDGTPPWRELLPGDDMLRDEFRAYARAAIAHLCTQPEGGETFSEEAPFDYERVLVELQEAQSALREFLALEVAVLRDDASRIEAVGQIRYGRHRTACEAALEGFEVQENAPADAKFCPHGWDTRLECGKCLEDRSTPQPHHSGGTNGTP